jgi:hypothetical protein
LRKMNPPRIERIERIDRDSDSVLELEFLCKFIQAAIDLGILICRDSDSDSDSGVAMQVQASSN